MLCCARFTSLRNGAPAGQPPRHRVQGRRHQFDINLTHLSAPASTTAVPAVPCRVSRVAWSLSRFLVRFMMLIGVLSALSCPKFGFQGARDRAPAVMRTVAACMAVGAGAVRVLRRAGVVRQLRHHLGPFLTHFLTLCRWTLELDTGNSDFTICQQSAEYPMPAMDGNFGINLRPQNNNKTCTVCWADLSRPYLSRPVLLSGVQPTRSVAHTLSSAHAHNIGCRLVLTLDPVS